MGKQAIIFSFVILTLVKACVIPLIYLDFNLHRDFIVKNLCSNRDRPQLNCNGKCYLAKRIAAAREHEQQEAERSFLSQLCEVIAEPPKLFFYGPFEANCDLNEEKPLSPYFSSLKNRIHISGIFHPPLAAC